MSGGIEANASGSHDFNYVGGIASHLWEGTIENCNFDGTVKASHSSAVSRSYAGGITGDAGGKKITISGCKVGSKSATSIGATDGLKGYSETRATDNYANVTLSGNCDHSGAVYGYRSGLKGTVSGNTTGNTDTDNGNTDDNTNIGQRQYRQ